MHDGARSSSQQQLDGLHLPPLPAPCVAVAAAGTSGRSQPSMKAVPPELRSPLRDSGLLPCPVPAKRSLPSGALEPLAVHLATGGGPSPATTTDSGDADAVGQEVMAALRAALAVDQPEDPVSYALQWLRDRRQQC